MKTSSSVLRFTAEVARSHRRRTLWVTVVQTFATATQGAGLLLLVPLLAIAGVRTGGSTTSSSITGFFRRAFHDIGLPVSLGTVLTVYVISVAASAALSGYSGVLIARCRLEFVDDLRTRLYAAVAAAEWRHLASLRRADLLTTLTVNVTWVSSGALAVLTAAATVILVAVQIAVAVAVSPLATLASTVTGAVVFSIVWPLVRRSRVLGREVVTGNRGVGGAAADFLEGLKLSKAHGLEAGHVGAFERNVTRLRRAQLDFARTSAISSSLQVVASVTVMAVVADVALGHLHTDVVGLLVLAFVFSRVIPQITQLQRLVMQVSQAVPAFDELTDLIADCENAAETPARQDPGRIALRDSVVLSRVGYVPPNGVAILRDIDLAVPALRTTALVGPSGAGKTTLADVVVGLLEPTTGSVSVDGRRLGPELRVAWRNTIALVPQDPFLFHDTIRANLSWMAPTATEHDMWVALETTAARDFVAALPAGLDTVVGDRGSRLSGGERQRIALARALLRRPDLLVLDEATSALDTENETAIRRALAALHGQLTVLIIAHRLSTVRAADSLVVLDGGRIVESGTWDELTAGEGRLRALIDAGEAG